MRDGYVRGHEGRNVADLGTEDEEEALLDEEGDGERDEQDRQRRASQRADEDPLDHHAEPRHGDHRAGSGREERQSEPRTEGEGEIRAERIEAAMGEVQDPGDAEDEREADGEERVDRARHGAVEEDLEHAARYFLAIAGKTNLPSARSFGQTMARFPPSCHCTNMTWA